MFLKFITAVKAAYWTKSSIPIMKIMVGSMSLLPLPKALAKAVIPNSLEQNCKMMHWFQFKTSTKECPTAHADSILVRALPLTMTTISISLLAIVAIILRIHKTSLVTAERCIDCTMTEKFLQPILLLGKLTPRRPFIPMAIETRKVWQSIRQQERFGCTNTDLKVAMKSILLKKVPTMAGRSFPMASIMTE